MIGTSRHTWDAITQGAGCKARREKALFCAKHSPNASGPAAAMTAVARRPVIGQGAARYAHMMTQTALKAPPSHIFFLQVVATCFFFFFLTGSVRGPTAASLHSCPFGSSTLKPLPVPPPVPEPELVQLDEDHHCVAPRLARMASMLLGSASGVANAA